MLLKNLFLLWNFFFFCPYNESQQAQQNIGQKQSKEELFFKIFSLVFQRGKQKSNKFGVTWGWVNDHINLMFVWTISLNKERTRNNCTQHYNTLWLCDTWSLTSL